MRTIDDQMISTEALAGFLDVKVDTFRTWQKRDGLLREGGPGRGKAASFGFAACLKTYVAKQLNDIGANTGASATFANHCDALGQFMAGYPLVVAFRDGKPSLAYDLGRDMTLSIPLEKFGCELASFFCHHVAATIDPETGKYGGPDAFANAKTDFEAHLIRVRARAK